MSAERPGGPVPGVGWVAPLLDLGDGDLFSFALGGDVRPMTQEIRDQNDNFVVIVAFPQAPTVDSDELARLRRWKAEAIAVLDQWERLHIALGSPGRLGESKAVASLAEIQRRIVAAAGGVQ